MFELDPVTTPLLVCLRAMPLRNRKAGSTNWWRASCSNWALRRPTAARMPGSSAEAAAKTRQTAAFPDGTSAKLSPGLDPREVFANWLLAPENPWFARNMANRVWFWLLGRGIVNPPDDVRPDNPPGNPELLAYLEQELVASRYDVKHLCRLILNSAAYQRSHISTTPDLQG